MRDFLKDLRKVPVSRILIPYLLGIVLYRSGLPGGVASLESLLVSGILLLCVQFLPVRFLRSMLMQSVQSFLLFILSLLSGMLFAGELHPRPFAEMDGRHVVIVGRLNSEPAARNQSEKLEVSTSRICFDTVTLEVRTHILVYLEASTGTVAPGTGETLLIRGTLHRIRDRGNPGEFDYAGYMAGRGTWYTMYAAGDHCTVVNCSDGAGWRSLPARISQKICSYWDPSDPGGALLRAITLGNKRYVPAEMKEHFSDAGAMHLLAVSGLHVGLIWWVLQLLLKALGNRRFSRFFRIVITLLILWFYAAMTGFSDSVTRSVTMFTLMTLSKSLKRPSNIYNAVLCSALLLLADRPDRLFDAGFQLSYTAVLGIVAMHPLIRQLFPSKGRVLNYVVDLCVVSIAAQLSTFPVSVFLFNQFPVYFLITNILAIPVVSVLLTLFVLFSPFLLAGWQGEFLGSVMLWVANILDRIITGIATLPYASTGYIEMDRFTSLLTLFLIFTIILFAYYRRVFWLSTSMVIVSAILLNSSFIQRRAMETSSVTVFNFNEATVVRLRSGCSVHDLVWPERDGISSYLGDYLEAVTGCSRRNGSHEMIFPVAGDVNDLTSPRIVHLCDDVWAIQWSGCHLLLCGEGGYRNVKVILETHCFNHVIFRRGYRGPYNWTGDDKGKTVFIADGTLEPWKAERLSDRLPGLHIAGRQGAYIGASAIERCYSE